jgi:hypothetical protein
MRARVRVSDLRRHHLRNLHGTILVLPTARSTARSINGNLNSTNAQAAQRTRQQSLAFLGSQPLLHLSWLSNFLCSSARSMVRSTARWARLINGHLKSTNTQRTRQQSQPLLGSQASQPLLGLSNFLCSSFRVTPQQSFIPIPPPHALDGPIGPESPYCSQRPFIELPELATPVMTLVSPVPPPLLCVLDGPMSHLHPFF